LHGQLAAVGEAVGRPRVAPRVDSQPGRPHRWCSHHSPAQTVSPHAVARPRSAPILDRWSESTSDRSAFAPDLATAPASTAGHATRPVALIASPRRVALEVPRSTPRQSRADRTTPSRWHPENPTATRLVRTAVAARAAPRQGDSDGGAAAWRSACRCERSSGRPARSCRLRGRDDGRASTRLGPLRADSRTICSEPAPSARQRSQRVPRSDPRQILLLAACEQPAVRAVFRNGCRCRRRLRPTVTTVDVPHAVPLKQSPGTRLRDYGPHPTC
jgi:hypothetical protein